MLCVETVQYVLDISDTSHYSVMAHGANGSILQSNVSRRFAPLSSLLWLMFTYISIIYFVYRISYISVIFACAEHASEGYCRHQLFRETLQQLDRRLNSRLTGKLLQPVVHWLFSGRLFPSWSFSGQAFSVCRPLSSRSFSGPSFSNRRSFYVSL